LGTAVFCAPHAMTEINNAKSCTGRIFFIATPRHLEGKSFPD
jgi:hypothetical protein